MYSAYQTGSLPGPLYWRPIDDFIYIYLPNTWIKIETRIMNTHLTVNSILYKQKYKAYAYCNVHKRVM